MASIGLDFETFSDVDLKTHGAARYFASHNFQTLCAAVAEAGQSTVKYDLIRYPKSVNTLRDHLMDADIIVAQNASFERATCKKLGIPVPDGKFIDSAVIARGWGAGSKLEAAAPQLLGLDKLELGQDLIRVFSVPTKENGGLPYTWEQIDADIKLRVQWNDFLQYCGVDAELGLGIMEDFESRIPPKEWRFEAVTQRMNDVGWFVDLPLVEEMQRRYEENMSKLLVEFADKYDAHTLNVASHPQLQRWCAARGVRAKSFDQTSVPKLIRQVERKLATSLTGGQRQSYMEVLALLKLKQELGGSSLSKLKTILNMVSEDGRLRGQYMHVGAGQTFRTSGRGVQMQNLTRLPEELGDVESLYDPRTVWDNNQLSENMRQLFKAEDPDGELIVGDFKSVESRGLAFLAGEGWKLDAYRANKDIYKMLATTYQSFGGVKYEDVTKAQRQAGKVGELACGYGAGAGAVQRFAEKMGVDMTEDDAAIIVHDWRAANQEIIAFWRVLDNMLHHVMTDRTTVLHRLPYGGAVQLSPANTPASLLKQHPGAQSISLIVRDKDDRTWLRRVFHGCYYRGSDVCYYKPSELKGGDLWRARMTTPPHAWYKLYGGKIAGILTQSFCRELFFQSLKFLDNWALGVENVKIVGQFHDEIVVEWWPVHDMYDAKSDAWPFDDTIAEMERAMSDPGVWTGFPLEADIKHAHRYVK